jgi:hypothetical protein
MAGAFPDRQASWQAVQFPDGCSIDQYWWLLKFILTWSEVLQVSLRSPYWILLPAWRVLKAGCIRRNLLHCRESMKQLVLLPKAFTPPVLIYPNCGYRWGMQLLFACGIGRCPWWRVHHYVWAAKWQSWPIDWKERWRRAEDTQLGYSMATLWPNCDPIVQRKERTKSHTMAYGCTKVSLGLAWSFKWGDSSCSIQLNIHWELLDWKPTERLAKVILLFSPEGQADVRPKPTVGKCTQCSQSISATGLSGPLCLASTWNAANTSLGHAAT